MVKNGTCPQENFVRAGAVLRKYATKKQ